MTKIFGIGFHKTGTTTLGVALSKLGYKVCGPRVELIDSLDKKDFSPVFEIVEQYDAFQDNPWPLLYKELDEKYPNSKFILTQRKPEKWIKSITNHFRTNKTEMRRLIYGINFPLGNEQIYLKKYNTHNEEVVKYFENRPDDLLIVNWENGDGWEKLCTFLGKKIRITPFPHHNKGNYSIFRKIKRYIRGY